MNKLSRRSFLAGASMATVAAAGAASALADSVPSDTAMSDAQNLALTNVNGIATDPGYVIDIANGEPRWAFEIAPDPIPAEKIAETGTDAFYLPSFDDIENYLLKNCKKNDLLITMGAGNVYSIGNDLIKN